MNNEILVVKYVTLTFVFGHFLSLATQKMDNNTRFHIHKPRSEPPSSRAKYIMNDIFEEYFS